MDDFVESLGQLRLLNVLEVFLEHLVEVEDEGLGGAIVHVNHLFEGHLDRHVNLRVLLHGPVLNTADSLAQIDHFCDKLFIFDFFVNEFVAFIYDEFSEMLAQ